MIDKLHSHAERTVREYVVSVVGECRNDRGNRSARGGSWIEERDENWSYRDTESGMGSFSEDGVVGSSRGMGCYECGRIDHTLQQCPATE